MDIGTLAFSSVLPSQYPYQGLIANTGPNDGSGVSVNWTVPSNVHFISAAASDGGTATLQGSTVNFQWAGTMAVGDTHTFGINYTPLNPGPVTNSFTFAADQSLTGPTNIQTIDFATLRPAVAITRSGSNTAEIFFTPNIPGSTLQQSGLLISGTNNGVWSNVPTMTSPYAITTTNSAAFFRLAPQ